MILEASPSRPNAYAALLEMYGDRLEPKETPALALIKSYHVQGMGLMIKSDQDSHPDCDEEKENPACQSGLLPYLRRRVPVRRGEQTIATPNDVVKYFKDQKSENVAAKSIFDSQFDLLKSYIATYTKSYVAAHTRTTADGRVINVRGFSNARGRDVNTPDLFRQHLAAPKMHFTPEQARNPELFTPDLFSGETKASRPKRFQVRDAAGKVVKEFHGDTAELDARQHILQNHGKRLSLKNVTFDD